MKVPDWLVHPAVCPVSVNAPEPEVIPVAKVPCIVIVLVAVPPGGVQDIVIVIGPPFMAEPKLPLRVVPGPKHCGRFTMPLKSRLLAEIMVLFWVRLKVKVPGCCSADVASSADHEPLTDGECALPPQAFRKVARARATD